MTRPASQTAGRYVVDVANRQNAVRLSHRFVTKVAQATLSDEQVAVAQISVALVSNAEMHALNREYLAHDYPTDVVSFLLECEVVEPKAARMPRSSRAAAVPRSHRLRRGTGKRIEGEIIISTEYAVEEAARYGWPAEHEVALYLVHGLLHLCGYDDLSVPEKRRMRNRERQILGLLKIEAKYTRKRSTK